MATIDFVFQPNSTFAMGDPTPRQFTSLTEGSGIQTSIPLTFTISAVQATDTVITFGLNGLFTSDLNHHNGVTTVSMAPQTNTGDINEQYDLANTFQAVIPAGQTTVTFQLSMSADNQPEQYEFFNLYIAAVSGGHTINSSDVLQFQQATYSTSTGSPFQVDHTHNYGFNTFRITDDDAPNGSNVLSAFNDAYAIPEGSSQPVYAGAGNDFVNGSSGNDTVLAHDGNDVVWGNGGNDVIHAGDGADQVLGGTGNDVVFGGLGADSISGDDGDDVLWGGGQSDDNGSDAVHGGNGNDTILGQGGDDILSGDAGTDAIAGGEGADTAVGGDGNDIIFGGAGNDIIAGEAGDDVLWGEDNDGTSAGNDGIDGGIGNDTILGQGGNDVLFGQAGNDAIAGGDGDDYILGGAGADILAGGNGADTFAFSVGDNGDMIIDFNVGGVRDTIDLRPLFDTIGYAGTTPRADGIMQVLQNGADTDVFVQGTFMFRIGAVVAAALDDTYFLFQ